MIQSEKLRLQKDEEFGIYWVKFMKSSTSETVKFVWMSLDRPTRSIRLLQTDRTSEDRLQDKHWSSHATNETNKIN